MFYTIFKDKNDAFTTQNLNNICASVSHAITEVLITKLERAMQTHSIPRAVLAGGVSANSMLREKVAAMAGKNNFTIYKPSLSYCTDNAAMIAATAKVMLENEPTIKTSATIRGRFWNSSIFCSTYLRLREIII